ncbi:hypothetical protein JD844_000963 [Phrynosoma platyrhinos]|uniref:Proteasome activator PA28 C-terminal domain-containing protein n=1 Tax=Phrynosoma platyrhinos TaxID=52577 RepID=A0ABQ7T9N9_PHRPL|nr:hypothetical protein JD844_000963 [Phrynosoma platyrhinos]
MATLEVSPECEAQVKAFRDNLCAQAPELSVSDLISLRVVLDIPVPDPKKDEERRKQREVRFDKNLHLTSRSVTLLEEAPDSGFIIFPLCSAPACGPVCHNEKITALLNRVKPEIQGTKEKLNVISLWLQLLVPRIEDGNNFGVAVQEKVYELLTSARTKLEGFQTHIAK